MTCVIIDDEPRAHHVLEHYISRRTDLTLAGNCYDAIEAYDFLKKTKVDLLFLDINMPEISGFKLLDMLTPRPMVIITTAYTDYALEAFEYNAIDYLHKPIRFERFITAVEKVIKWRRLGQNTSSSTLRIKVDGLPTEIECDDIYYTESLGNYIKLVTARKSYLVLMTTKELEASLPADKFVRIHKSYIVNTAHIDSTDFEQVRIKGLELRIGKTYKKYFDAFFSKAQSN